MKTGEVTTIHEHDYYPMVNPLYSDTDALVCATGQSLALNFDGKFDFNIHFVITKLPKREIAENKFIIETKEY